MRLALVELRRFRGRRVIGVLVVAALLVAVALAGRLAWDTRPLSASERREAASQADLEGQRSSLRREVRACEADPPGYLGPGTRASDCAGALVPTAEAYYPRDELSLRRVLRQDGLDVAVVVICLLLIAGCTFAGSDWATGSIDNQLLFEPRRGQVWAAKAAAVALAAAAVCLLALGLFWLVLWLVARARGLDPGGETLVQVGWHLLRAVGLAAGAAVGGFALTMLFRHTVATLAALFVYSVGGEILIALLPIGGAARFSLGNNVIGWLAQRHRYIDTVRPGDPSGETGTLHVMSHLEAGAFLAVLLFAACVASVLAFRRRDL